MAETILVLAAHPDDEVLGCGATLARHAAYGDHVHAFIVAEGATSRGDGDHAVAALREAAQKSAAALGFLSIGFGGLPDNKLDSLPLLDIIKAIEPLVNDLQPDLIYTHHGGDLNIDHRIVYQAVRTVCRPLPGSPLRQIRCFETPSSTEWGGHNLGSEFRPNLFIDVESQINMKRAALQCYQSEMRPFPHARSNEAVDALARLRGSQAGFLAAEAFEIILALEPAIKQD